MISATALPLIAAQLPSLAQTLIQEVGPIAHALSTSQLVRQVDDVAAFHVSNLNRAAAAAYETYGFILGFRGYDHPTPFYPVGPERTPTATETFLEGIRSGAITTLGTLSDPAREEAEQFRLGALKVFPPVTSSAPIPPFLQSVSRAWGRYAVARREADDLASLDASKEMGQSVAGLLLDLYKIGLAGGLSPARLNISLHARDIPGMLGARGWLTGLDEMLYRRGDAAPAEIIDANLASIITCAFNNGEIDYVKRVAVAVTDHRSFRRSLTESIEAIEREDPRTGRLLWSRRKMVISKLLHSGVLTVTPEILRNLKGWRDN